MSSRATSGRRRFGSGARILAGMAAGVVAGAVLGERAAALQPVGDLFIRLLVLAAVPLVSFNLLAGLAAHSGVRAFGRLAARILAWFVATDLVALGAGMGAMSLLRPGAGMELTAPVDEAVGAVPSLVDVLLDMIPVNLLQSFADGNIVQVVVASLAIGVATLMLEGGARARLEAVYRDLADLFRRLVDLVLTLAPLGIGALMAVTVGRYGSELIGGLARFLAGVWGAQAILFCGYMLVLRFLTAQHPRRFLGATGPLWATTAATSSSLASLSVGLEKAEQLRMPRAVYSFTLPLGAQLNKDGTAVMLGAVLVFTAQAAGVAFGPETLVAVLAIGLLLSQGSGGIPGGGFVVALVYVRAFGLPIEIAAMVGGIYRLVDMGNTTLNIMGDMVGTALVAGRDGGARTPAADSERARGGVPAAAVEGTPDSTADAGTPGGPGSAISGAGS